MTTDAQILQTIMNIIIFGTLLGAFFGAIHYAFKR